MPEIFVLIVNPHASSLVINLKVVVLAQRGRVGTWAALDSLAFGEVLDLGNGIVEDLLLQLVVLECVLDLADHRFGQQFLFLFTLGGFESNPRVEHGLDFGSKCRLLAKLEYFLLRLSSLLGDRIERLSETYDILLLLYRADTRLHCLGMFCACAVQDV